MGAFEGSLSFTTFYVEGEPSNNFQGGYLDRIMKKYFKPLDPAGDEERSIGWVPAMDPMAENPTRDQFFYNQYIVLALRIDKWSIPTPWLKAKMNKLILERYPGPDKKISKRAKNEIKQEVLADLKEHILPAMKVIDVCWNIADHKLRFWSTSKKTCEEFIEFFEDTFELTLTPDSPYMMAQTLGFSKQELDKMVNADPWHPAVAHAQES